VEKSFFVLLKMLADLGNTLGQLGNLAFDRASVGGFATKFCENFFCFFLLLKAS